MVDSGVTVESVVGITRTFGAPAFQITPTGIYLFDSWSDGGTSIHTVDVVAGNPTYTANYTQVTNDFDDFYFIQDLYNKVVKRDPTAEELQAAVDLLAGPTTRQQLADSVWNSVEHREQQVNAMYLNYLDRIPAPGERNVLVNAMVNGMSEGDAALTLVNGAEYVFRININTNDVILDFMYQDILGRNVDSAGRKEYLPKLNNGSMTRAQVAQTLMNSDERFLKVIDEYYVTLLGRPRTNPVGVSTWHNAKAARSPSANWRMCSWPLTKPSKRVSSSASTPKTRTISTPSIDSCRDGRPTTAAWHNTRPT